MAEDVRLQSLSRRPQWRRGTGVSRTRRHRHGGAGRHALDSGAPGRRSGGALELQGGQVRLVQRRDQWLPAADVQDATRRFRRRRCPCPPDAHLPGDQGSGDRRVLELPGQQANRARLRPIPTTRAPGSCTRKMSSVCTSRGSASSASSARTCATCCATTAR